jgi:hypothetical protein
LWPSEEYPAPTTGQHNIQSLDPIRRENNCVIDYDESKSSFVVKGGVEDVQEALLRIRGLLCKAVVQRSPIQRLYLVQNECQNFVLTDHALKVVYRTGTSFKQRIEKTVKSVGARPRAEDVALNAKKMKDLVVQTLSKVHWHQGHVDMRVHLGTLTLQSYEPFENNTKTLLDFKEMIKDSYNFRANVTEE